MARISGGFLCLHLGAGFHSSNKEAQYKDLCQKACLFGAELLNRDQTCVEVAVAVTAFLERSSLTNAGYGSNLTLDGNVECEAAIMDSQYGNFAAVGCVSGVQHPIKVAEVMLRDQNEPSPFGLVSPMVIVGSAVKEKAKHHGLETLSHDALISSEALKVNNKYRNMIRDKVEESPGDRSEESSGDIMKTMHSLNEDSLVEDKSADEPCLKKSKNSTTMMDNSEENSLMCDTIGVICVDSSLHVSSAISSGGLILKQPGRLGPCTQYGCGCWSHCYDDNTSVACCTSGTGEAIIRTNLAKQASEFLFKHSTDIPRLDNFIRDNFIDSKCIPASLEQRLCGMLVVYLHKCGYESYVDFHVAHSTDSFCIGYIGAGHKKPKFLLSRLDRSDSSEEKSDIVTQGFHFPLFHKE